MLINFLTFYSIFVMLVSLSLAVFILRAKKYNWRIFLVYGLVLFIPAVVGYTYVVYFSSIPEVIVPDIRGLPLDKAIAELKEAKLKGAWRGSHFNIKLPEGSVLTQRPEPGRRVKLGRIINVITSSGQRKVFVPNLLGRSLSQAKAVLAARGLVLGQVQFDFEPSLAKATVLSQEPLPEEEVALNVVVKLVVSTTAEAEMSQEIKEVKEEQRRFKLW